MEFELSGFVESALGLEFRAGQARRILKKGTDRQNATQLTTARRPSNFQFTAVDQSREGMGRAHHDLNDHRISKLDSETCRFLPDCTVAAGLSQLRLRMPRVLSMS